MTGGLRAKPRGSSTICLPIDQQRYTQIIDSAKMFREWIDKAILQHPELFPEAMALGYELKDSYRSKKLTIRQRRIVSKTTKEAFTVKPSFVMPYMVGLTEDVEAPLFLRAFGVPFWALAHVFGKDPMYWYRLEIGLGRNSIVGTTIHQAEIPKDLVADEHHQTRDGVKNYVATTVGGGCCLGAELSQTAGADDLTNAYGIFQKEAQNVEPDYQPQTVNTDGWAATKEAWQTLFSTIAVIRCYLHGWLNIRKRAKHLGQVFWDLGKLVWGAFRATNRRSFGQRLRRLWEWTCQHVHSAAVREQVQKLCRRVSEYGKWYDHPRGQRTSNMLDRVMRSMNRYFDNGQHMHGSEAAVNQHCRAWALIHNFRPWSPKAERDNNGWRSPAERLNKHRYHDNWLQNLLVSASLAGYRRRSTPQNP
jgi:hypothetical protein